MIKNVLLLSLEDLNDWIEPLAGHPDARTPNLARLADRSVLFTNAQAPAPACGPSRTATLFGQAPWRTGVYRNKHDWQKVYANSSQSLPGLFKGAGWTTLAAGRIFYRTVRDGCAWTQEDRNKDLGAKRGPLVSRVARSGLSKRFHDFGSLDGPHSERDRRALGWMLERMPASANRTLWALGLYSTHLPFTAPPSFIASIPEVPRLPPGLKGDVFDPEDLDELSGLSSGGLGLVTPLRTRGRLLKQFDEYDKFVRAYLACIAFADSLVGQLLDHLEETGLIDSTLIVMWSDHGWQFGEKQAFSKYTLWDRALRVPFMFSSPDIRPRSIAAPVSLLDLYPTVAALLDLRVPHLLDGSDLSAVLEADRQPHGEAVSAYAVKGEPQPSLTVRTRDFRLIDYSDGSSELFDHRNDPYEHTNLYSQSAGRNLMGIVQDLRQRLPTQVARSQF